MIVIDGNQKGKVTLRMRDSGDNSSLTETLGYIDFIIEEGESTDTDTAIYKSNLLSKFTYNVASLLTNYFEGGNVSYSMNFTHYEGGNDNG